MTEGPRQRAGQRQPGAEIVSIAGPPYGSLGPKITEEIPFDRDVADLACRIEIVEQQKPPLFALRQGQYFRERDAG